MSFDRTRTSFRTPRILALIIAAGAAFGASLAAPVIHAQPPENAAARQAIEPYSRVNESKSGILTLELATRTFVPKDGVGPRVHLASAVHIADKSFYDAMQALLDKYDVVLFEGVKPGGTGAFKEGLDDAGKVAATKNRMKFLMQVVDQFRDKEGRFPKSMTDLLETGGKRWRSLLEGSQNDAWGHPLALSVRKVDPKAADPEAEFEPPARESAVITSSGPDGKLAGANAADDFEITSKPVAVKKKASTDDGGNIQAQMARALGLVFQLDIMDSGKPNWRSSDMDIDQLEARFEAVGADGGSLLQVLDGGSIMAKIGGLVLGFIGSSPQLSGTLKMMMVDMLAKSEEMMASGKGMPGMANMTTMFKVIIEDRNQVVLADLKAIIANEKNVKDVAIFYGAGHMNDFQTRLMADLGYQPEKDTWTQAIRADPRDAGMTPAQAREMRRTMQNMIQQQMK